MSTVNSSIFRYLASRRSAWLARRPFQFLCRLTEPNEDNRIQLIPLTQLDADPRMYKADITVESSGSYTFTISGTDVNGNTGHSLKTVSIQLTSPDLLAPARFSLLPNYPNPFNPETWIPYQLPEGVDVTVKIYSVSGHLIRALNLGHKPAGFYTHKPKAAYWDGKNEVGEQVSSGVYFYTIQAGEFTATKKMVVAD